MTSIKISKFQLHEQLIEFRLNSDHRAVQYDFDIEIHELFKNQLNFQAFHIRFMTLKRENDVQKQKIARLRTRRNDYRQKSHQLKRKMTALRTQLEIIQIALRKQQHNDSIVYDSNANEQSRKSNILRFDFHFFNRTTTFFSFFIFFIFFSIERFVISTTFMHDYHIKYFDIDDFHDDKKMKTMKRKFVDKDLNLFFAIFYRTT